MPGAAFGFGLGSRHRKYAAAASINALATPTLALFSSAGTVPVVFTISDTDYVVGFYGQLQIATDSGFSSITQNIVQLLDGDSWSRLDSTFGFVDPSGTYYARFRMLKDNESGSTSVTDQLGNTFNADASAWSNTVTDTISVSVATWNGTTGTNKSQYLTGSNGNLTMTMNNSVSANCGVRATIAVSAQKTYHEHTIVSHGSEANGSFGAGVTDGTLALGPATFPQPGNGTNAGCSWRLKNGSTNVDVFRNGAQGSSISLTTALADGDKFGVNIDNVANTVTLFHKPGAGAWYQVQQLTLTSNIPSSYYGYANGFGRTGAGAPYDSWTTNFGGSSFSRTLDTGYVFYG